MSQNATGITDLWQAGIPETEFVSRVSLPNWGAASRYDQDKNAFGVQVAVRWGALNVTIHLTGAATPAPVERFSPAATRPGGWAWEDPSRRWPWT